MTCFTICYSIALNQEHNIIVQVHVHILNFPYRHTTNIATFTLFYSYIEAVDSTTDIVGYSSELCIIGILIESITEQGDEQ